MLEQFHFTQPLWLLALLPIFPLIWFAFGQTSNSKSWEKVIDPKLLPLLLQGDRSNSGKLAKVLLAVAWLIAVVALANPVWDKVSRPIFQTKAARVIVLDLSNSMLIDDLKPNRLARARFKIEDILSRKEEGQTALVLFAGDAFTAAPLTRDTETIRSLLKILSPQLMPAQGSRADLGLKKAHELLKQAGSKNGQVLLIADGDSKHQSTLDAVNDLKQDGHQISVLGVGTGDGGYLKFRNNKNIRVKLDTENLQNIAQQGGGSYHIITTNNLDLQRVLQKTSAQTETAQESEKQEINNEEWKSTGPLLVLALLPLAALAFRKGWLLNIILGLFLITVTSSNQVVYAQPVDNMWHKLWTGLSQNKEQQAQTALLNQNYEDIESLSKNPLRLGSALYKQEKFEMALNHFQKAEGADARYNQANTLAKLKQYQQAIAQYDEALKIKPDMQDAIENKKIIEEFLKQKQQQEANQQQQNQQSQSDQQASNQESQDNADGESGQQSEGQKEEQNQAEKNQDIQSNNQFSDASEALEDKNGNNEKEDDDKQELSQDGASTDEEETNNGDEEKPSEQQLAKENQTAEENSDLKGTKQQADTLTTEEQMAAEQWLRRIPDDPGGLLRRKFRSQYNQRRQFRTTEQPW